jgi:ABC-2 type transport system ATP-binding protein
MLQLFRDLHAQGLTLLVSSHRLPEMETILQRAAIIMGGRLLRDATLDELLSGRDARLAVRALPVDKALAVLQRLGVRLLERRGDDELVLAPGAVKPAAVNAELVRAGCEVAALVPERVTLQSAFEALVDEQRARGVEVPA